MCNWVDSLNEKRIDSGYCETGHYTFQKEFPDSVNIIIVALFVNKSFVIE